MDLLGLVPALIAASGCGPTSSGSGTTGTGGSGTTSSTTTSTATTSSSTGGGGGMGGATSTSVTTTGTGGGGGGAGGATTTSGSGGAATTSTTSGSGGAGGAATTSTTSGSGGAGGAATTSTTSGSGGAGGGGPVGGEVVWAKPFLGCSRIGGVATDGAGHIAIGGTACGPNAVDFGGGHTVNWWPGTMHAQGYVTGFDGAGTSLWIDPLTNIDESGVSTRLHDANAAGQLAFSTNSTPFGGGSYTHYGVIDATGAQVWLRTMKNFSLGVQSLALDVAGGTLARFKCFGAACSIGVGGQVPVGISLVKLSAAGAFGWQKKIDTNGESNYATAGFPTGEFLGFTGSGFNFGCGPVSAHLARFDASGACVWAKSFLGSVPALHAATNAAGEALVVATFTGLVDFGCGPVSNAAGTSLAVSKFNAAGTCLFTKTFTGPGFALGPNADPFPAPHSTGAAEWLIELPFKGAIDLGGGPISPPDPAKAQPLFIKLDASGNPVWSRLLVTPYFAFGNVDALGFTGDPSGGMVLLSNDPMLDLGSGAVLGGNVGLFLARFAP